MFNDCYNSAMEKHRVRILNLHWNGNETQKELNKQWIKDPLGKSEKCLCMYPVQCSHAAAFVTYLETWFADDLLCSEKYTIIRQCLSLLFLDPSLFMLSGVPIDALTNNEMIVPFS